MYTNHDDSPIASLNPLIYKDYVYDYDTQWYYLQSRYYDPEIGRFVNSDAFDIITASMSSIHEKNLFAYCDNNPIIRRDNNGAFFHTVLGAISGAIVGGTMALLNGDSIESGIVSGAISGAGVGLATDTVALIVGTGGLGAIAAAPAFCLAVHMIGGALGSALGELVRQKMNGEAIDGVEIINSSIWGSIGGALTFGMGSSACTCDELLEGMFYSGATSLLAKGTSNMYQSVSMSAASSPVSFKPQKPLISKKNAYSFRRYRLA